MNAHLTSIRTTLETGLPVVRNKVSGYLLELCGLKPGDLGIYKTGGNAFPSDEELDSIMEEDE